MFFSIFKNKFINKKFEIKLEIKKNFKFKKKLKFFFILLKYKVVFTFKK